MEDDPCKCATEQPPSSEASFTSSKEKRKIIRGETFSENTTFAISHRETLIVSGCKFLGNLEFTCSDTATLQLDGNIFNQDVIIKPKEEDGKTNYYTALTVTDCDFFGRFKCYSPESLNLDKCSFYHNVFIEKTECVGYDNDEWSQYVLVACCKFLARFECHDADYLFLDDSSFHQDTLIEKKLSLKDRNNDKFKIAVKSCKFFERFKHNGYARARIDNRHYFWSQLTFQPLIDSDQTRMFVAGVAILCSLLTGTYGWRFLFLMCESSVLGILLGCYIFYDMLCSRRIKTFRRPSHQIIGEPHSKFWKFWKFWKFFYFYFLNVRAIEAWS